MKIFDAKKDVTELHLLMTSNAITNSISILSQDDKDRKAGAGNESRRRSLFSKFAR